MQTNCVHACRLCWRGSDWIGRLRFYPRSVASTAASLVYSDQISARDFSHMPWQRRDQWNAGANSRIGILVQANGGRDSDELRIAAIILAGFAPLTLFVCFN